MIVHDQYEPDRGYYRPRKPRSGYLTFILVAGAAWLAYVASPWAGVASHVRWVLAGLAGLFVLRWRVR